MTLWPEKSSGIDGVVPLDAATCGWITYWAAALLETSSQTVTGSMAVAGRSTSFRLRTAVEPASVVREISVLEPSLGLVRYSEKVTGCVLLNACRVNLAVPLLSNAVTGSWSS